MAGAALPSKTRVNKAGEALARWWDLQIEIPRQELADLITAALAWRAQHAYPMALTVPSLRNWVGRYSSLGAQPSQRLKRMPQILNKLLRHPGMKLARMQDIGGARAILANDAEVDQVYARIRKNWTIDRVKDYRAGARADTGYRALHVMVLKRDRISGQDRVVEIQLRTASEHLWAETVTTTGDRTGYALRDGDGPPELVEYFRMASDLLWIRDHGLQPDRDFSDAFATVREQVRPYFRAN